MKHTLALSMIPVVVAWVAAPRPIAIPIAIAPSGVFSAAIIEPKNTPVQIENITARRSDSDTFRLRWSAAAELPPAIEVHYVTDHVVDAGTVALIPPAPPPSRQLSEPRQMKRVALQTNVCTRHGMRKVQVGKRWRCRR
jgi:hypothetical protein